MHDCEWKRLGDLNIFGVASFSLSVAWGMLTYWMCQHVLVLVRQSSTRLVVETQSIVSSLYHACVII